MAAPASPSSSRSSRSRTGMAATLVIGAMIVAACGGGDGTTTIRLAQDDPNLSPSADDLVITDAGGSALDLEFVTFDGDTRNTSEFSGRPLVINFFAASCAFCIAEMPDFETVFRELHDDVAFLGLSQDVVASEGLAVVAETGVTYDIGWDPNLDVYLEFGGFAMPTSVFVSAAGEVIEVFPGALSANALREKIDAIRT